MRSEAIAIAVFGMLVACGGSAARVDDPSTSSTTFTSSEPTPSSAGRTTSARSATVGTGAPKSGATNATRSGDDAAVRGPQSAGAAVVHPAPDLARSDEPSTANRPASQASQAGQANQASRPEGDAPRALTPMDQGGGDDRTITAAIRRAVVADDALSFSAKNVKIITVGGKVTLRGAVKSDDEKTSIEGKAKQTAGVSVVDNQLEVKK